MTNKSKSTPAYGAYFNDQRDLEHYWGPPEIVIPFPEMKLSVKELHKRAEKLLNDQLCDARLCDDENDGPLLDDLIQEIHNTQYDGFTFYAMLAGEVEYIKEGWFSLFGSQYQWQDGERFVRFFTLVLDSSLDADGLHIFAAEDSYFVFDEETWCDEDD